MVSRATSAIGPSYTVAPEVQTRCTQFSSLRMSIADDGAGLPDDYATRGQGFRNMREDAERLGGRLVVETTGSEWRTTVICELPYRHMRGGS